MNADGAQEFADQGERGCQVVGIGSEPDAEVAVHLEEVAGHDEHAVLVTEPLGQHGRADRMRVAHERDGASLGCGVGEETCT